MFPSQLTGVTEQVSDLTSLQMCVAGTSHGSADYTPNSLTFQSGGATPRLKQLRKKKPPLPGVSLVHGGVFCEHNPIHNEVTREQITRSENAAISQAQERNLCSVGEKD